MSIEPSPNVRVHDLGLAAALVSTGHQLRGTNRDMNGRAYFMFCQTSELAAEMNEYWNNALIVKARLFFDNIKMLKTRIYSEE